MRAEVLRAEPLVFDDGAPVRAASAVVAWGNGWLVAQDDGVEAAWWRPSGTSRVPLLPGAPGPQDKPGKPDLEAAVGLPDGRVLLLGSGSTAARQRGVLLGSEAAVLDLSAVVAAVAELVPAVNLEGACLVGPWLRWWNRGLAGSPSTGVDLALADLLAGRPVVGQVHRVALPDGLAVTDAVTLPSGSVLVSCVAEQTASTYDDGPVTAVALAVLDGDRVLDLAPLAGVGKVEGLALRPDGTLLAVVDADDPARASTALTIALHGLA